MPSNTGTISVTVEAPLAPPPLPLTGALLLAAAQLAATTAGAPFWIPRTTPLNPTTETAWAAVAWSPALGLFVAVEGTTPPVAKVATSPDGVTWTVREAPAAPWAAVQWSAALGLWVATAGAGAEVAWPPTLSAATMTSPDGVTWTLGGDAPFPALWRGLAWSPALSLLLGIADSQERDEQIMRSSDGLTWTTGGYVPSGPFVDWRQSAVVWADALGLFVVVGQFGESLTTGVATSPDGLTWTTRTTPETATGWTSLCWSPELGRLVATGPYMAMTSTDAITWTLVAVPARPWNAVAWCAALATFAAVSTNGYAMRSAEGLTWTADPLPAGAPGTWFALCASEARAGFVAVGTNAVGAPVVMTGGLPL